MRNTAAAWFLQAWTAAVTFFDRPDPVAMDGQMWQQRMVAMVLAGKMTAEVKRCAALEAARAPSE
jgi:hypothetical protein